MNKKGYTIPEMVIVAVVVGLVAFVYFNKASYALDDSRELEKETSYTLVTKSAQKYGESILDTLIREHTMYVTGSDLQAAGFLVDDNNKMHAIKVEITYNESDNTVSAKVIE